LSFDSVIITMLNFRASFFWQRTETNLHTEAETIAPELSDVGF